MLASQKATYSVLSWATKTAFAGFPAEAGVGGLSAGVGTHPS